MRENSVPAITACQMRDFWEKVSNGLIDEKVFASFLKNPRRFSECELDMPLAEHIMGRYRVISAATMCEVWGFAPFHAGEVVPVIPIPYSIKVLEECAYENYDHRADWRLVYLHGFSLREQVRRCGCYIEGEKNSSKKVVFEKNTSWCDEEWANIEILPGYYLLNFKNGLGGGLSWEEQEKWIKDHCDGSVRACANMISEALISIISVYGEKYIPHAVGHWGECYNENALFVDLITRSPTILEIGKLPISKKGAYWLSAITFRSK